MNLLITTRCNFECDHCLFSCTRTSGEDMSWQTFMDALKFDENDFNLHLVGGEPFLHKDLADMISEGLRQYEEVSMVTNGSMVLTPRKNLTARAKSLKEIEGDTSKILIEISNDYYHDVYLSGDREEIRMRLSDIFYDQAMIRIRPRQKPQDMLPLGRAIESGVPIKCDRMFLECAEEYFDPCIYPNGDVSLCCNGRYIIGNVVYDTYDECKERLNKWRPNTSNPLACSTCPMMCEQYKHEFPERFKNTKNEEKSYQCEATH